MNREITKAPYCKPAIRVVEWDFNENICNSVITNSYDVNSCLKIKKLNATIAIENRSDYSGDWEWTRTGSR
jgi:hypothetical protein